MKAIIQGNLWFAVTDIQRKIFKFPYKSHRLFQSLFVTESKSSSWSANVDDKLSLSLICTGNNYAVSFVLIHFNQFLNLEI